ncbi:N-acyl homoserine lactonase family protein [Sphingomonas jaspsi]|uniref:N-acyl homoserine lactonase family protein n=1 Tax=Sphingomonas jaspsi TaxID=392409 RepID=UPI0004B03C52|nr:N-acyl homoserine lactonase family protein [Sphingomonas jaspsi]
MLKYVLLAASALALPAAAQNTPVAPSQAHGTVSISLTRLDCGSILIKDFDAFFSDAHDYKPGPRRVTDSCYLIRHGDKAMLWDTGLPAALKGQKKDMGAIVGGLDKTVVEQLAELGLKPADISVVGISHMHSDHTGQAADFGGAKLVVGKGDYDGTKGEGDPFGPWRSNGDKNVTTVGGSDFDVFGDGRVVVLRTPGHTPNHLSLLVRLASGPVLLTGDLYHSTEARLKKGVPPFNTDRADTLASMDRFEKLAKNLGAKVIIQHEPADIAKLPAFPKAAK